MNRNAKKLGRTVSMDVITYSLRDNEDSSDGYYYDVSIFTDEVLNIFESWTHSIVEKYMLNQNKNISGDCFSKEEYSFELLTLGTLWQIYSGDANGLEEVPRQLLIGLTKLRKEGGTLKPEIDFIRGILATIFLSPDLYDNTFILDPKLEHMEKLIYWLSAIGEFNQEVKRLSKWQDYLKALPQKEISDILTTAITMASWFQVCSEEALGKYTQNVENYLNELRPDRYWHEDVIFCGRRRVEYHLNMVGAEIMNRAYKKEFGRTGKKVVLIPACMRILSDSKCKADTTQNGFHCTGCTKQCSVNQLTILGVEYGFDVVIVPHESSISSARTDKSFINKDIGVVGVACVLNLISGGWMLKEMGIPSQCVLLDYCGCKNHWSIEGFPTQININQLKNVLGIDRGAEKAHV